MVIICLVGVQLYCGAVVCGCQPGVSSHEVTQGPEILEFSYGGHDEVLGIQLLLRALQAIPNVLEERRKSFNRFGELYDRHLHVPSLHVDGSHLRLGVGA